MEHTNKEFEELIERQTEAINDCISLINLKDDEIKRQISKRKLAEQIRNWTVILTVLINVLIYILWNIHTIQ